MKYPEYVDPSQLKQESDQMLEQKVSALLAAMTQEEKLDLCHGHSNPPGGQVANAGYLPGIPRLGVPEIRMYDGPAGVTSVYETTGLPVQEMLAATWDQDLAYQYGKVEGSENVAISGNTHLGSQFDVVRVPQFSRDKDMLGEDSFLTAALAVPETKGIQEAGAVATLKHFGVASIGTDMQNAADQLVDEQTLHEIVFPPFEAAAKEGRAGSFMCCYNKFNGAYASANEYAQKTVLRDMWNYKGYMMSDWGANHSLTTGKGMDVEMPTGTYNSSERILRGIEKGRLTWDDVENAARHVLYGLGMAGYLSLVQLNPDGTIQIENGRTEPIRMKDRYAQAVQSGLLEDNAAIALEVARKGAVLLKNEGHALPLTEADYTGGHKTALIGLGAKTLLAGSGQERSYGQIRKMIPPETALKALAGEAADISGYVGLDCFGTPILAAALFQDADLTKPGLIRSWGVDKSNAEIPAFLAAILGGNAEKPEANQGGGGKEFHGVASAEDDDEAIPFMPQWNNSLARDVEGHETGSFCQVDDQISFTTGTLNGKLNQTYKNGPDGTAFQNGEAYTWDGYLMVPESGVYTLILQAIGGNTCFKIKLGEQFQTIGSTELREGAQWPWGSLACTPEGMEIHGKNVPLEAGVAYPIRVCANATIDQKDLQLRLSWITPAQRTEDRTVALQAAASADKVVFFLTEDHSFQPLGQKMDFMGMAALPSLEVPAEQLALLRDVKAAMKPGAKLIVVHNNGQLYALGEVDELADALLNVWFPGQEGGKAISELLLGRTNPSGKLALTIPARDCDTLVTDTPEHRTQRYEGYEKDGKKYIDFDEGIFCGYRWYDKEHVTPLYAFGHGLSYTSFFYSDLAVQGHTLRFAVTNTGDVAGTEIAQVYLGGGTAPEGVMLAGKQLCGFARLEDIQPGERREVTITIPERSFCCWNPRSELVTRSDGTKDKWVKVSGPRTVMVGPASDTLLLTAQIPE